MKLLKGKRLKSVASSRNQPGFRSVHFLVDGPASVLTVGERPLECGTFGCVIALGRIQRLGLRFAARLLAGVRPRTCLGCWRNGFKRPVLKHGPRSATRSRVFGWKTRARNESESRYPSGAPAPEPEVYGRPCGRASALRPERW